MSAPWDPGITKGAITLRELKAQWEGRVGGSGVLGDPGGIPAGLRTGGEGREPPGTWHALR